MNDGETRLIDERVSITRHGGVAEVFLERPDKMNALDHRTFAALIEAAGLLGSCGFLRAVVLAGRGRAFCAGIDLKSLEFLMSEPGIAQMRARSHGDANLFQKAAWAWRELPVPVIAALHGTIFGGGLQIAMAADIRICAADAKLSVMEVRWGIVPDMAGTLTLRDVLPEDVLRELVYTARVFSGEEAKALGVVTTLDHSPLDAAMALAQRIAVQSPRAVRTAKKLLNDSRGAPVAQALAMESGAQAPLIGGPDQREALLAQQAHRPAFFADID